MADRDERAVQGQQHGVNAATEDVMAAKDAPPVALSADLLSAIAIHMTEVADLSALFDLLSREFGRLGLGLGLTLPLSDSADPGLFQEIAGEEGQADGDSGAHPLPSLSVFTHYLSDSIGADPDQGVSLASAHPLVAEVTQVEKFISEASADGGSADGGSADGESINDCVVDFRQLRHPRFVPEFASLAERCLPHASVAPGDAGLQIPLARGQTFSGLMSVWGAISPEHTTPLSAFAGMVGLCLRNLKQTERHQVRYRTEQEILINLSQILLTGREIEDVLQQVAAIIHNMDESSFSTVYLYDPSASEVIPVGAGGWDGGEILPIAPPVDDEYINGISYVFHKRTSVIIDDEHTEARFGVPPIVAKRGFRSVAIVPMLSSNQTVLGMLTNLSMQSYTMSEERIRLLSLIANNTAQAVERLRLFQDTERQLNELSVMHEATRLSADIQDEDALIEAITKLIGGVLYPDNFGFFMMDEKGTHLVSHPSYRSVQPMDPSVSEYIPLDTGVCGRVARTGKPMRIDDITQEANYLAAVGAMRSELCVPLVVGETVLGVINAEDYRVGRFTVEDERILVSLSSQIAAAIQRLRLVKAEHHRQERMDSLRRATATLASTLELDDVLDNILNQLRLLIEFDSACIFLHNEWGLLAVAGIGFDNIDEIVGHYFSADRDLYRALQITKRPLILADTRGDDRFSGWAATSHIRGWLGVPMMVRDRVIGYITIDSHQPNRFNEDDAALAMPFGRQAAMVIENARLFQNERRQHVVAQMQQEAASLLTSQAGEEQVMSAILGHLRKVVPYDSASIMLLNSEGRLTLAAIEESGETDLLKEAFVELEGKDFLSKFEGSDVTVIGDVLTDERWIQIPDTPVRSWVGAILSIEGKPIGLLNIDGHTPYSFDQTILPTVRTFASQAALAIYNARMFEQTQRTLKRTELLYSSIQDMIGATELESVVQIVAEQCRSALSPQHLAVYLFDMGLGQVLCRSTNAGNKVILDRPSGQEAYTWFETLWTGRGQTCLETMRPLLLSDESDGSAIYLPLIEQGTPVGLIHTHRSPEEPPFTSADLDMLGVIGHQATVVIQNLRLYSSLDAEKNRLDMLYSLIRNLASSLDLATVLDRLMDEILVYLGGFRSFVLLADPDSDRLKLAAVSGLSEHDVYALDEQIKLRIGQGLAGHAAADGQPIVLSDVTKDPNWLPIDALDGVARSAVAIPLFAGLTLIGVINLASAEIGFFDDQDLSIFNAISVPIALAIQNAQYYAGLQHRADELRYVSDILRSLNSATELSDAHIDLVLGMQSLTGCQDLYLYELDEANLWLEPVLLDGEQPLNDKRSTLAIPLADVRSAAAQSEVSQFGGGDLLAGEIIYVTDLDLIDPSPSEQILVDQGIASYLLVPLRVSGRVVGGLQIGWSYTFGLHQQQLPVIKQISDAIAMLIEKGRLLAETNQRAAELQALYGFSSELRAEENSAQILVKSLAMAAGYLQASRGMFLLPRTDSSSTITAYLYSGSPNVTSVSLPREQALFDWVFSINEVQIYQIADFVDNLDEGFTEADLHSPDLVVRSLAQWHQTHAIGHSLLLAPIRTEQKMVGTLALSIDYPQEPFTASQQRLLGAMSEIVGNVMERAMVMETLEQRVDSRTKELAEANEQLKQLDRLKSEFVANVSHELRTPLTNIKLYLHLLERRKAEGQETYLSVINEEANHLHRLLETILDLSHLDADTGVGSKDFDPLEIGQVVRTATAILQESAQNKGIALETDLPEQQLMVRGNRELLAQLLNKLITNAINYSSRGDVVWVRLSRQADRVCLAVEDLGMGISPEERPHIFERFFRSTRATDANIPGTGLGLSVVKEIVVRHEAEIEVISEVDQGSTFIVWFPAI